MISYRLRKTELVFLLDFFGDIKTLPQSFGNIYIDRQRYSEIADNLHTKGIIKLIDSTASVDLAVEAIFDGIYSAAVVFTDENLDIWCYCSDKIIIIIRSDHIRKNEYIITPVSKSDMLEEILEEEYHDSDFIVLRPISKRICSDKIHLLLSGEKI